MNNWISVKDKLPDNPEEVIIFCANGSVTSGKYVRASEHKYLWMTSIFNLNPYMDDNLDVSHWQPLPKPPKN